jgi:hypothetical protein
MRIDVETTAMPLTADVERHQSAARSATQIFIHGRDHITNIQIKSAGIEDAPIVALLGRLAFSETFGHLFTRHTGDLAGYLADTFGLAKIRGSLGQSENQYWLALADGLPIGYAKLKYPSEMPQLPNPLSQNSCHFDRIRNTRAMMEGQSGSIRTIIQGPGGRQAVAT